MRLISLLAAELVPDLAVVRRSSARTGRWTSPRRTARARRASRAAAWTSALALEIDAPRILRREVRLDAQRRADRRERLLRPLPETSSSGSRTCPSSAATNVHATIAAAAAAPSATDSRAPARPATPSRIHTAASAEAGGDRGRSAISTTSSRIEPVLKLRDHRRRRVAGDALPHAALHRGDEIEDPRADRDAEREDRRRRRMLGHATPAAASAIVSPALSTWPRTTVASSGA